jgi:hypothetical protein
MKKHNIILTAALVESGTVKSEDSSANGAGGGSGGSGLQRSGPGHLLSRASGDKRTNNDKGMCLFVCLSACLLVCLSACLLVCLSSCILFLLSA